MGVWDTIKGLAEDFFEPGKALADLGKLGYEIAETEVSHIGSAGIGWMKGDDPSNIGCELITTKNCQNAFNFGPGSNPFNCYYTFKGKPLRTYGDGLIPLKADCNTIAWLAALGLIIGFSIAGLMAMAILLELGLGVAPIMEFFLQAYISFLSDFVLLCFY